MDDGGPAFPADKYFSGVDPSFGMSLRDYFAAHAIAALLRPESASILKSEGLEIIGDACYEVADILLKARKKKA